MKNFSRLFMNVSNKIQLDQNYKIIQNGEMIDKVPVLEVYHLFQIECIQHLEQLKRNGNFDKVNSVVLRLY